MAKDNAEFKDVIKDHATALVAGMLAESEALPGIKHPGVKGRCRELLFANLLEHFLPTFLSLSTGIIVNRYGETLKEKQSGQTDIIIYDNRILPPFLKRADLGLVPVESVIAVIEVKTTLEKASFAETKVNKNGEEYEVGAVPAATHLMKSIPPILCDFVRATPVRFRNLLRSGQLLTMKPDVARIFMPLMGIFAFRLKGPALLRYDAKKSREWQDTVRQWCEMHAEPLQYIAVAGTFSCLKVQGKWRPNGPDETKHEEVKRFIAVLLDSCRTKAHARFALLNRHFDWLSAYIRHQAV